MRPADEALGARLARGLAEFERSTAPLEGIEAAERREAFVEQLVESDRRKRFRRHLLGADVSRLRTDPQSDLFDPLRAAVLFHRSGDVDEAFWMLFLFVHFGRNARGGWRYAAEVYGRGGGGSRWDWDAVSARPEALREWLQASEDDIIARGGGFGNHRKYERLTDTGQTVVDYVGWVGPSRRHRDRIPYVPEWPPVRRRRAFADLFESMATIHRFGRVARFDYLAAVSHLDLGSIEPDHAYLAGGTGPLVGARLLFGGERGSMSGSPRSLEERLALLDDHLKVGMDTLEDALCNWQKSPDRFKPFRG